MKFQKTIKNKVEITGIGLHTGIITKAVFKGSKANTGIKFRRIDLDEKPYIDASIDNVSNTNRRTVLEKNGAYVETVEHVLAAILALSIDNIIIELDGPEVPILDGSSSGFINALEKASMKDLKEKRKEIKLQNYFKVELKKEDSRIEFFPNKKLIPFVRSLTIFVFLFNNFSRSKLTSLQFMPHSFVPFDFIAFSYCSEA